MPALAAAAVAAAAAAQAPAPWPDGLATFAWLDDGMDASRPVLTALRDLGLRGVTVSQGQSPALANELGLAVLRDQLVGKGVLELRREQFEPLRDAYERERRVELLVRPACLSEIAVREQLVAAAAAAVRGLGDGVACAATLGDEISSTRHVAPLDTCFGSACLGALRAGLRARFGAVAELNRHWGTSFADWDAVQPYSADRIRARELAAGTLPRNLAPWAMHRALADDVLGEAVTAALDGVRGSSPKLPCGLTGLQPPSAYGGGGCYARLLPRLSLFEAYDVGGSRDLLASYASADAREVATLFVEPGAGGDLRARLAELLARGTDGVVVWRARALVRTDAAGCPPTPAGLALRDALAELAPVAAACAGARVLHDAIWLLEEHASVRAHWMLDSAADGDTWIRRLSSYEETHSTSMAARTGWLRLLRDLGLQPRFVAAADLGERLRHGRPRVLVLPAQIALTDDAVAAIASYARSGGTVVADMAPALYDGDLRLREQPALDRLFGVARRGALGFDTLLVREGRPSPAGRLPSGAAMAEAGLRGTIGEAVADSGMVQLEAEVEGGGRAVYLNLAVCEYLAAVRARPDAGAARDLRRRVGAVLGRAGLQPGFTAAVDGLPPHAVERTRLRTRDGRYLLSVRPWPDRAPADAAAQVRLGFGQEVRVQVLGRDDGPGAGATAHTVPFDPVRGVVAVVEAVPR